MCRNRFELESSPLYVPSHELDSGSDRFSCNHFSFSLDTVHSCQYSNVHQVIYVKEVKLEEREKHLNRKCYEPLKWQRV